jgi:hypothetical protein
MTICVQLRNWVGSTNIFKEVLAGPIETQVENVDSKHITFKFVSILMINCMLVHHLFLFVVFSSAAISFAVLCEKQC